MSYISEVATADATVSLMTYSMFKLIHNLHAKASSVCDVSISRANFNQGCCTLHVSCRSS